MSAAAALKRNSDLVLAIQHHAAGRLDEAERLYRQLHQADPGDAEVLYLMGVLCCDLGLFEAARGFLKGALAIDATFPEARRQLAHALNGMADEQSRSSNVNAAEAFLMEALHWAPDDTQTLRELGRLAILRADAVTAEVRLGASLTRCRDADALNWLGLAQLQQEKFAAAETALREALSLRPDLNQARNNLGLALQAQGRLDAAQECFEGALARDPSYASARINLADVLRIRGEPESARRELTTLLAVQPDCTDALNNLGAVLQDLGLAQAALACLTRAAALSPQSPQIRWNLALTQLQLGDFPSGWSNFESRWEGCGDLRGGYRIPKDRAWRGEALSGKRLLLWAEQGLGDTLQFCRYAKLLADQGASVILEVQSPLAGLLSRLPGISRLHTRGDPLPDFDYHCPLLSLPLAFKTDLRSIPAAPRYLHADARKVSYWKKKLGHDQGKMRIGLTWSGNSGNQRDRYRSIPLSELLRHLPAEFQYVALQKDVREIDRETLRHNPQVMNFDADQQNFADAAALCECMDLIVSVDTSMAHLGGALGKETWILLSGAPDWRWLLERIDSPWYPTVTLYRQGPAEAVWAPVLERLRADLLRFSRQAARSTPTSRQAPGHSCAHSRISDCRPSPRGFEP